MMAIVKDFSLDAKYRQHEGRILLSGIQALVRLPLEQHRADERRGLNTATLIAGYRGSPLGGLDTTLERNLDLLREHQVVFLSGVNEDLGATAIFGAQQANLFPRPRYDGVLGMWYGKRSEEHTSELQSRGHLVCRLLLEKKKQSLHTHRTTCNNRMHSRA